MNIMSLATPAGTFILPLAGLALDWPRQTAAALSPGRDEFREVGGTLAFNAAGVVKFRC